MSRYDLRCSICHGQRFEFTPVLWPGLVDEWGLSDEEAAYIDRQQGERCVACGATLRAIALGRAISGDVPLRRWAAMRPWLRVLELNPTHLGKHFRRPIRRTLARYPDVDMMALPYDDGAFDLVIHSDTLEHVSDPVKGLAECRRVLSKRGRCCYTVPVVIDRMTRTRDGLPQSFHGTSDDAGFLVVTEYGADFWRQPIEAGFANVEVVVADFPAAFAVVAR